MPNLPYKDFLCLQEELTKQVRNSPQTNHLIFCRHPTVLTQGLGERQNGPPRPIPDFFKDKLINIRRGGGVTFHGLNQLVIYPIVRLSRSFSFKTYLKWLQHFAISLVNEHLQINLEAKNHPLGLWKGDTKYASIGIGINRFITNHGLALNIGPLPFSSEELHALAPCGINGSAYGHLAQLNPKACADLFFLFLLEKKNVATIPIEYSDEC